MARHWLRSKWAKVGRAKAELRSLHRSQVSLYPDSGVRHQVASGVTSPAVKVNPHADLIEQALKERAQR